MKNQLQLVIIIIIIIIIIITRRNANWSVHMLRRNCLLKRVIEGKIEGKIRRGRRRKQPLDDLENIRYCKLKLRTLDYSLMENWLWKRPWKYHKTDCVMQDRHVLL